MRRNNCSKVVCSVTEMAEAVGLSRARFYQLQREEIFPPCLYDLRTKRPFFDLRLQKICHEIKETGVGFNGSYILFYSPRAKTNKPKRATGSKKKQVDNSLYQDITETLCTMGLNVTNAQVSEAVEKLYPDGIEKDEGVVIREIFRFLKKVV